jgi:hypothetical protein
MKPKELTSAAALAATYAADWKVLGAAAHVEQSRAEREGRGEHQASARQGARRDGRVQGDHREGRQERAEEEAAKEHGIGGVGSEERQR